MPCYEVRDQVVLPVSRAASAVNHVTCNGNNTIEGPMNESLDIIQSLISLGYYDELCCETNARLEARRTCNGDKMYLFSFRL